MLCLYNHLLAIVFDRIILIFNTNVPFKLHVDLSAKALGKTTFKSNSQSIYPENGPVFT